MVTAHLPVDIAALKERQLLGDIVEASGVRLRGRGRGRQGVWAAASPGNTSAIRVGYRRWQPPYLRATVMVPERE